MNNEDKNNLLKDLVIKISNDMYLDNIDYYIQQFNNIYTDDFRHEYSTITGVLFSVKDIEGRDVLTEKIKYIEDRIKNEKIKIKMDKLWDHINLENIRLAELNKISIEANRAARNSLRKYSKLEKEYIEAQGKWNEINKSAEKALNNLESVEKKINDSTAQSITILGIFAGIVMAFTGGLSFIASSLQNINAISKYRLVFVIILLAAAIFNVIFMLIYVIGKLTGAYIGSNCNCDCQLEGCKDKTISCSAVRYPIAIWSNTIILISLLGTFILYIIDKYNIVTRLLSINTTISIIIMVAISLFFIGILIAICMGVIKLTKVECKYEVTESIFSNIGNLFFKGYEKKKK